MAARNHRSLMPNCQLRSMKNARSRASVCGRGGNFANRSRIGDESEVSPPNVEDAFTGLSSDVDGYGKRQDSGSPS